MSTIPLSNATEKRWDLFGIGAAALDDLLYLPHYPQPNEKLRIQARLRQAGGLTATALVTAARQGSRALFCGVLGEDESSRFILEEFAREGVDTTAVFRLPHARPYLSTILVDTTTASRTVLSDVSAVVPLDDATIFPQFSRSLPQWLAASRMFFVDHTAGKAGLLAAELARSYGLPVVADLERPELPGVESLLAQVDHLVVNLDFARRLTDSSILEEMFAVLAWRNPHPDQREPRPACVITGGDQGCWYCERGGEIFYLPAFSVQVVDTTGCGDVFHGAYAAAIARGESVSRAVLLASASAALKAAAPGGRLGIPRLPDVLAFLEANPTHPSPAR